MVIIIKNKGIYELYINLPAFSESSFEDAIKIIIGLNKKFQNRCLFCANDYGTYYFLYKNNMRFLVGRILLKLFGYAFNRNIDMFLKVEGGVFSKDQKFGFLEGKNNNIEIGYNHLISVSLECKHKKCNYDCVFGKEVNGMNKKMFLCGRNLYHVKY